MRLSRYVSAAMVVGALGFGVIGPGGAVASADPVAPAPLKPHDDFCPWWAGNRHDWWDDRNGPPPWGWGPPPAYQWDGGPPRPFNYWGYNVNPVWDNGFGQWGIWLFGLWIPIFGIQ